MSVVEEVKQKIDIVEVISQYTKLTRSGRTFKGLCPFHSEKHGSFFVYPDQQSWHCFGACGTGGDVYSFLMKKENLAFGEALRQLADKAGIVIPQEVEAEKVRQKYDRLYEANDAAAEYYHQLLLKSTDAEKVRSYLIHRGLNAQSVETFRLGYSPNAWDSLRQYLSERGFTDAEMLEAGLIMESESKTRHDRFRYRLMFPIADTRGRIIGFGARALDDAQPKYLNSPDTPLFHKGGNLYALHLARDAMRKQEQAVLVEGYMDVILPHQYGFNNVLASMGTAITEDIALSLKKITRNIVLAMDADVAGEEAMLRALPLENVLDSEIRMVLLPEGKDPDELILADKEAWPRLITQARPILDYAFERAVISVDLKSARGKSAAADKLLPLVGQIKEPVRQSYYLNKLAELVGVSPKKLELMLAKKTSSFKTRTGISTVKESVASHPLEDYCLSLLLQHPELIDQCQAPPEFFESAENREIYRVLLRLTKPDKIKDNLDTAIWEHYEALRIKGVLDTKLESKLAETVLRLHEAYLKRLAQKRAAVLPENTDEDISISDQDVAVSQELKRVFQDKEKLGIQKRRNL
jgi:DNA primase